MELSEIRSLASRVGILADEYEKAHEALDEFGAPRLTGRDADQLPLFLCGRIRRLMKAISDSRLNEAYYKATLDDVKTALDEEGLPSPDYAGVMSAHDRIKTGMRKFDKMLDEVEAPKEWTPPGEQMRYTLNREGRIRRLAGELHEKLAAKTAELSQAKAEITRLRELIAPGISDECNVFIVSRSNSGYRITKRQPFRDSYDEMMICLSFDDERPAEVDEDIKLLVTLGVFDFVKCWTVCPNSKPIAALVERIAAKSRRYDKPRNTCP